MIYSELRLEKNLSKFYLVRNPYYICVVNKNRNKFKINTYYYE